MRLRTNTLNIIAIGLLSPIVAADPLTQEVVDTQSIETEISDHSGTYTTSEQIASNTETGSHIVEDTTRQNSQALTEKKKNYGCGVQADSNELVDRVRASTHTRLCNTAGWLDGLFGDREQFRGQDFRGKVAIGLKHDEIESLDPRLRVRIKTKLPNVSKRFNAFLGRVEEDSYVSNTEVSEDRLNNVGLRSTNDEDSEWLIGLGYKAPSSDSNGWDFSVGAKISSGFKPYTKVTHRYYDTINDQSYWKTSQTLFWRKEEGFGVSSNADYVRLIGDKDIWITHASVKYTEEEEQVEWFADTRWHHSFDSKRGISSSLYVRGEAESEVSIPEYGLTFTYIRPILRDWLFVETGLDWRWEKQTRAQSSYKNAFTFGIQFEMLMGDYYRRNK